MEINPDRLGDYMLEGIDHAPDAVYWIDWNGRFLYANETATKYLGYSREELTSMSVMDINPSVDEKTWPEIWLLIEGRESVTFDSEHRRQDGSLMPVEVTARMIELDGNPLVLAFARDESDRFEAETKLKQSQQRLQSILDHTSAVIFMKDIEGRYLLVNRQYLDLFSLGEEDDIVGRTDYDIFEESLAEAFRETDRSVIEGGERIEVEEIAPHDDGLHTYISTKFPLRNEAGEIFALGGIATDITPRKRAMEQADLQARRIRRLYDAASISGLSFDERIEATLAAGCEMLGMETGAVSQVSGDICRVRNLWPADQSIDRGEEMKLAETYSLLAYRAGDVVAIENMGATEDYRKLPSYERFGLNASIGASIDVEGELFGTLIFLAAEPKSVPFDPSDCDFVQLMGRWISTMIEAAEAADREQAHASELERSNRDLEDFAYVASHDLKEPLRTVSNFAQLFERKFKGQIDDEADEFIGHLTGGTKRMRILIDDLLLYSQIGMRRKALNRVSLESALDEALNNLSVVIRESGAEIVREKLPDVIGDHGQLVQLLQNLIGNAIKFRAKDRARIEISCRKCEKLLEVAVRDNGPGIEPKHHARIFKIFQRLHGEEVSKGSGIGLAVCRRIAERHGGEIRVESVPGEGSVFLFTLSPAAE